MAKVVVVPTIVEVHVQAAPMLSTCALPLISTTLGGVTGPRGFGWATENVACDVTSNCLPSLKTANTASCWVAPIPIRSVELGTICTDLSWDAVPQPVIKKARATQVTRQRADAEIDCAFPAKAATRK